MCEIGRGVSGKMEESAEVGGEGKAENDHNTLYIVKLAKRQPPNTPTQLAIQLVIDV